MAPRIYSTRSNAVRGLKAIHPALAKHASNLIRNMNGKFIIKMDEVDELILEGFCEQFPEDCEDVKSQLIEASPNPNPAGCMDVLVERYQTKAMEVQQAVADTVKKECTDGKHCGEEVAAPPKVKPFRRAKEIVAEMVALGITSRKDIIGACMDEGIKYNTADGAYYELVVRPRKESK